MRAWRVTTPELSGWLRSRGFPATQPGQHLSARAQEFIFHEGGVLDARVELLETAFVLITLKQGRAIGILSVSGASRIDCTQTNSNRVHPSSGPIRKLGAIGRGGFARKVLGKSLHVEELSIFLPGTLTSVLDSCIAREAKGETSP